jgi:twitching motility protein PilT
MTPEQRTTFEARHDLDFAYSLSGVGRFRVSAMMRRGSVAMVARHIPHEIPSAAQLGLPGVCRKLAERPRGLVIVTGPTGSGKSTSLAAIVDFINSTREGHILTLEDPIEFIHADKKCITQRQIGDDTETFAQGLRSGLRQDPDIIMIGEMRDLETVQLAITAAETGHLVLGTLHTTSAITTVDRIIDVFPHESQQQVRVQLANSLQGVISQCLVPRIGGGRIAAHEVLVSTDGVRSHIRDGKTGQLFNALQTGRSHGMILLEERLVELVKEGYIEEEAALRVANRREDVASKLKSSAGAVG